MKKVTLLIDNSKVYEKYDNNDFYEIRLFINDCLEKLILKKK